MERPRLLDVDGLVAALRRGKMTSKDGHVGASRWLVLHSANARICHWINVVAGGYLLLSGIHIFLDFPELYWGHTGYQGYPAIFKLSDWGLSWDEAGALGNRMWGRNYHFTSAWVFLINGLVYTVWSAVTGHVWSRVLPGRAELTAKSLRADLAEHLRGPSATRAGATTYGPLQKVSYSLLIFVFVPIMLLTGLAQAPAFAAAWPWLLDMWGGRQSARTLHALGTAIFVLFVMVHVVEVMMAGGVNRIRSMITGKFRVREEGT